MKTITLKNISMITAFFALVLAGTAAAERPGKDKPEAGHGLQTKDHGKAPWITDIEEITIENNLFRVAKWTGKHIQMTLMSIPPGGEIGGEIHSGNDQFIRIESGTGRVMMGKTEHDLVIDEEIRDDWAVLIPAGYWHNIINTGDVPLKIYAIYGPPEHPHGTIHHTFEESEADHHHSH